jgi:hypothetical protein
MDGFFAAYLTGRTGTSVVLFALRNGHVIGVDVGGLKYEGRFETKSDGTGFSCRLTYTVPAGGTLITGFGPAPTPTPVTLPFDLPTNFAEGPIVRIETPMGPLNAKFAKLADLDL